MDLLGGGIGERLEGREGDGLLGIIVEVVVVGVIVGVRWRDWVLSRLCVVLAIGISCCVSERV